MLRSMWRGALGVVVWGALAVGALAQTNVPQTPSNYKSPSGAYVLGGAVNLFGIDSVTGAECLVGLTPTCYLPGPGGGTVLANQGTAGSSPWLFNLDQVGGVNFSLGANTKANSLSFAFATDQTLPPFASTPTFNLSQASPGVTNGVVVNSSATATAPVTIRQTLTTSAVQLASNVLTNGVIFYTPSTDTGTVCVGPAGVTTATGYCMSVASGVVAGSLGVNNTNLIYVIGTNTSDTIEFLGN